jgi:hypothetical protein
MNNYNYWRSLTVGLFTPNLFYANACRKKDFRFNP